MKKKPTNHDHECYGKMFPNLSDGRRNVPIRGAVFSCEFIKPGPFISSRKIDTDLEQWDRCVACPEFASCYPLSMAKFNLGNAVRSF